MTVSSPDYHPFYCEENIWRLSASPAFRDSAREVVFIGGLVGVTPLFGMRAAADVSEAIFWDYHVILLAGNPGAMHVWDLDSRHGFPLPATRWFELTVPDLEHLPVDFHPHFRVVDGPAFERDFSTDRSHMLDENGDYIHPPPAWTAPSCDGISSNLDDYRMLGRAGRGRVMNAAEFLVHIS